MKNIYLIGFMGTGKSTVGRMLAEDLGANFVDTDKMVEGKTGKTISDIFEESSEEEFRRLETDVLREITDKDNLVVSTGGGIVVTRGNLELMKETGIVITLIADVQTIMDRVMADGSNRPLLEVDEPFEEIKKLLFDRASFYINAHHIVETSDISAREAANQILDLVKEA
ncbi:MAG: shikimate kinase [Denitrovibrio sp.]|nr:MAG: shikimate kinase [Denitrovibrio sp.]